MHLIKLIQDPEKLNENQDEKKDGNYYDVLPVSVIDISKAPKTEYRNDIDFDKDSSRSIYSSFSMEACQLAYQHYLRDCKNIFDPFAGWGERHFYALKNKKNYTGYDINPEAIKRTKEVFEVDNILGDSLIKDLPEKIDGVFTCPPYWNLELYANNSESGDRKKTWPDFLKWYSAVFKRIYEKSLPQTIFVIVVGNWRKKHIYYDLDYNTRKIFSGFGAITKDVVVLSRKNISKIKIMIPQAKEYKYSINVNDFMLVFQKPDEVNPQNLEKK